MPNRRRSSDPTRHLAGQEREKLKIVVQLAPGWRVGAIPCERRAHAARAPPRAGRSWRRVRGRASRACPLARAISVARFGPVARRERLARLRVAPPRTRATLSHPRSADVRRTRRSGRWRRRPRDPPPLGTPPRPVASRFTARAPPRTAHSSCSPPRTPATTTATPRPPRRHPPRCSPRPPTTHP